MRHQIEIPAPKPATMAAIFAVALISATAYKGGITDVVMGARARLELAFDLAEKFDAILKEKKWK